MFCKYFCEVKFAAKFVATDFFLVRSKLALSKSLTLKAPKEKMTKCVFLKFQKYVSSKLWIYSVDHFWCFKFKIRIYHSIVKVAVVACADCSKEFVNYKQ